MYIRFVVGGDRDDHRHLDGIVSEAQRLRKTGALSVHEEAWLEEHFHWLNIHLPVPPYRESNWPRFAAAWFKDSATDPIRRMRAIAALLEQHGLSVRTLRSKNPGKIHYEDAFQVVVREWNSL